MVFSDDIGSGDVFWSLLWFTLFFMWIWLVIVVFSDIFRSDDLNGWEKALWTIFVVFLPYLGVLVYMIARGHKMADRSQREYQRQEAATREYIQSVAGGGGGGGAAAEIAELAKLRDQGAISEAEFEQGKARALSS